MSLLSKKVGMLAVNMAKTSDQVTPSTTSLSFFQEEFWRREQLVPGTFAHISRAFSVAGPLSQKVLEAALSRLVQRHEALAYRFAVDDEENPVAWTDDCPSLAMLVVDLTDLDEAGQVQEVAKRKQVELDSPFDLCAGPLLRATLLRLGAQSHVLVLTVHHIACDAWSLGVLLTDLAEFYAASMEGRAVDLAPLPIEFRDAIATLRSLTADGLEGALAYWGDQLVGLPSPLELSTRRRLCSVSSYRNARLLFELDKEVVVGLSDLGARARATPFMVLLAGFQVTLAACSGGGDIVVASLFSGRTRVEFESVVGLLASPTAFRVQLPAEQSFLDLLARSRAVVLDAFEQQATPITEVIGQLDLGPVEVVVPALFSVWLNQIPEPSQLRLSGTIVRSHFPDSQLQYEKPSQTWDGDQIAVTLVMGTDAVGCIVDYNVLLFDEADVKRLVATFLAVIDRALRDPSQRVAALIQAAAAVT